MSEPIFEQYFSPNPDYSVLVEDDGRVAYGYIVRNRKLINRVWLYNRAQTPEKGEWAHKELMPFMNPRAYIRDEEFIPPESTQDISVEWTMKPDGEPEEATILIRSVVMARITPEERVGRSRLAKKNNPLARVLDISE
jgi:hypothetical protein